MDNLKAGFYPFIADYENTHQLGGYTDLSKMVLTKIPLLPSRITKVLMIQTANP